MKYRELEFSLGQGHDDGLIVVWTQESTNKLYDMRGKHTLSPRFKFTESQALTDAIAELEEYNIVRDYVQKGNPVGPKWLGFHVATALVESHKALTQERDALKKFPEKTVLGCEFRQALKHNDYLRETLDKAVLERDAAIAELKSVRHEMKMMLSRSSERNQALEMLRELTEKIKHLSGPTLPWADALAKATQFLERMK